MRIKMKSTRYGSADSVRVDEYKKGETYDVGETLASIFLREGWAVNVCKKRKKDAGSAPENKTRRQTKRGGHGA